MKDEIEKCVICGKEANDDYEGNPWCGDDACGLAIERASMEIEECGCR